MKRLLLIGMLLLGSNLGTLWGNANASNMNYSYTGQVDPGTTKTLYTGTYYSDYPSYIAAVDKGNFDAYGTVIDSDGTLGGTSGISYDGLSAVEKKEGKNSPRAQKIRQKRASSVKGSV